MKNITKVKFPHPFTLGFRDGFSVYRMEYFRSLGNFHFTMLVRFVTSIYINVYVENVYMLCILSVYICICIYVK